MFILERISGWDLGAILSAAMLAKCLSSQVSTKSISPRYQLTIAGMSSHGTTTPQGPRTGTVPLSKGLSPSCVLSILSRLIEVIEYLHGCGIAHRDIKPKNIMLSSVANSRNPSHSRSIGDALCTQTLEMKTSHSTSDAFLSKPDEKAISCTSLFRVCELKLVDFGSARHKQRPRYALWSASPCIDHHSCLLYLTSSLVLLPHQLWQPNGVPLKESCTITFPPNNSNAYYR